MKWAGHVLRMNDGEPTKKLMLGKPDGTKRRGRPKFRWIDGLQKYLHNISIRNWKNIALDRSPDGSAVLSRPRPTLGCSAHDDDDDNEMQGKGRLNATFIFTPLWKITYYALDRKMRGSQSSSIKAYTFTCLCQIPTYPRRTLLNEVNCICQ
jgi:hypothetical protein